MKEEFSHSEASRAQKLDEIDGMNKFIFRKKINKCFSINGK